MILTPSFILKSFWKTKYVFLCYLAVTTVSGYFWIQNLPDTFSSRSTFFPRDLIQGDDNSLKALGGFVPGLNKSSGSINYILSLSKSYEVCKTVLDSVNFYPYLFPEQFDWKKNVWKESTHGNSLSIDTLFAVELFRSKHIEIESSVETGLITITTSASDPVIAYKLNVAFNNTVNDILTNKSIENQKMSIQRNLTAIQQLNNSQNQSYLINTVEALIRESLVPKEFPLEVIDEPKLYKNPIAPNKKLLLVAILAVSIVIYSVFVPLFMLFVRKGE